MNWNTLECPRCGERDQFLLSDKKRIQLRKCSGCEHWFLVEDPEDESEPYRLESLDHPPTCPAEGCEEVVHSDELPNHIIETHDGELP